MTKFKLGERVKNEKFGAGMVIGVDKSSYLVIFDIKKSSLHSASLNHGYTLIKPFPSKEERYDRCLFCSEDELRSLEIGKGKSTKIESEEKEMSKVKIGDRVRMIRKYDHALKGETGTVIAVLTEKSHHDILVMFDKKDNWKHSGSSPDPDIMVSFIEPYPSEGERNERCQYVYFSDVEVIDSNIKMIVVVDGVKGIATAKLLTGKRTVATGTAKCAPTDTFKTPKGINLAVQRCIATAYPEEPITVDPAVVKDVGLTTIL